MLEILPQFLKDGEGNGLFVVLSVNEFEATMEELGRNNPPGNLNIEPES